jgi:cytochrome c
MFRDVTLSMLILMLGVAPPAAAQESDGKISFNNHCRTCHSFRPGDNRLGPSLFGIFGAEAGQVKGYAGYSGGLRGFAWNEAVLERFIANPTSVSMSTNMVYPPIADGAERRRIINFLKSLRAAPE